MLISPGDVPKAAIVAANRAIKAPVFGASKLNNVPAKALQRSFPHRVEALSVDQLEHGGNNLRQMTQPRGWRFLVHDGPKKAIAAVRVVETEGGTYNLGELSEGAFVSATEDAVRFAEAEGGNGHFEAVLLIVPELCVAVLWLQSLDGGEDLILTLSAAKGSGAEPRKGQLMPVGPFVAKMRDLAKSVRSRLEDKDSQPRH